MDYEFVMKSICAAQTFEHKIGRVYDDRAHDWAVERFGPEAAVSRIKNPENKKDPIFNYFYEFHDNGTWANVSGDFHFHNADQAFEFKMRWG